MTTQILFIPADPNEIRAIEHMKKLLDEYFAAGYIVKGASGAGEYHCYVLYKEEPPAPVQEKPIEEPKPQAAATPITSPAPNPEPPNPPEPAQPTQGFTPPGQVGRDNPTITPASPPPFTAPIPAPPGHSEQHVPPGQEEKKEHKKEK